MGINTTELERLAGLLPPTEGYQSFGAAARGEEQGLDEDIATGAKGWLSGVMKALGTWKGKMQKGGASPKALAALDAVGTSIQQAMGSLGEERVVADVDLSGASEDIRDARANERFEGHNNWAAALLVDQPPPPVRGRPQHLAMIDDANVFSEGKEEDAARKLMIMGLWKKFSAQLKGSGYAKIDGKKHVVRMRPGGDIGGDMISLMTDGKDTALEDLNDAELKTMFVQSVKWLMSFENAWVKKNLDAIKAIVSPKPA